MRHLRTLLATAGLSALTAAATAAPLVGTQSLTYSVDPISEISVSGNPAPLVIDSATPGLGPTSVTDASTTYAVTTNLTNQKITAALNADMPTGVTLTLSAQAPSGAASAGAVTLTASPKSLVTAIGKLNDPGKTLTYTLSATLSAGVVATTTRTVTLTILNGP